MEEGRRKDVVGLRKGEKGRREEEEKTILGKM